MRPGILITLLIVVSLTWDAGVVSKYSVSESQNSNSIQESIWELQLWALSSQAKKNKNTKPSSLQFKPVKAKHVQMQCPP